MKRTYRLHCVAYGKYDLLFAVEAESEEEALEIARKELAADGITEYTNLTI